MIGSFINAVTEKIYRNIDTSYIKKEESKEILQDVGMVSTAVLTASLALTIMGMTITGGFALIAISLPLGYLSYNACKVAENMQDVINNYKEYELLKLVDQNLVNQKLKKKLSEGTFCFWWMIELAARNNIQVNRV